MSPADWRALIEAYLDSRLSAEAFTRRFVEAWREGDAPRWVAQLQPAVEAFEADLQDTREEGAINDDDLRDAARRALAIASEDAGVSPHTFDRTRTREEMRRVQFQVQGCAGVGCLFFIIWVGLCLLQVNYVIVQLQSVLGSGAPIVTFALGAVLAFVPLVGNLLAFFGATSQGWHPALAAIVFFAAPAATIFSGWMRYRRYQR
ncbi:hypothetical protein [Terricaulis sp.]|uniref:hypothetical protein n=1 Tax=Terricaulis sp. TaxID=2768686 RepID=UPI0037845EA2